MAFVSSGDHVLLADTVYPPIRDLAENNLILRISIGLEDITDLEADLDRFLATLSGSDSPSGD